MKTTSRTRAGSLASLSILAAVALMALAQVAQAALVSGAETGTAASSGFSVQAPQSQVLTQIHQREVAVGVASSRSGAATGQIVVARGVVAKPPLAYAPGRFDLSTGAAISAASQSPASSGTPGSVWIGVVAIAGALLIGVWALFARRRQPVVSPDCESSILGC